ncbi:MAG: hypothetical protein HDR38_07140 [Treponema sp.]|nr:hypothetical protein [Treponema sp.]
MNINKIIFTRTAPSKKVGIVKNLTIPELLSINYATIMRVVKETGTKQSNSRNKTFRMTRPVSNDWNAEFEGVNLYRGKLLADIYLQYDSTDTNVIVPFEDFLKKGDFRGSITRSDSYNNPQTHYFTFREIDKAIVLGRLLMDYLNRKYKDKLG